MLVEAGRLRQVAASPQDDAAVHEQGASDEVIAGVHGPKPFVDRLGRVIQFSELKRVRRLP